MKEYVFTGTWSFSCYAESEEEARKKYNDCGVDEIDIDFSFPEVEEIEYIPLSD